MIFLFFLVLNFILVLFSTIHFIKLEGTEEIKNKNIISLSILVLCFLLSLIMSILILVQKIQKGKVLIIIIVLTLLNGYISWEMFSRNNMPREREIIFTLIIGCIFYSFIIQIGQTNSEEQIIDPVNYVEE
jgi:hypothetical protein